MAPDRHAFVVVDLGFGDAGKGTITDFLVRHRRARTVVRFNGSAQAGHNVVTADGRHHTFAQLGSGTFVPGVRTHLSRQVLLHPTALLVEARVLADTGVADALDRLTVSDESLVITPFQQSANRLRELARGEGRHGSCGVGVGETMADALLWGDDDDAVIRARDLLDRRRISRKLDQVQQRKRAQLAPELRALEGRDEAEPDRRVLEDRRVIDTWLEMVAPLLGTAVIRPDHYLAEILRAPGDVVFEGAQGVLLDEWRGFHPNTTWSACTFANALGLLEGCAFDGPVSRIGVTRTTAVRHGPGPFPTEAGALSTLLPEPHNVSGLWQGVFRRGWIDAVLLRYALAACGGADALALTHLDSIERLDRWRLCDGYRLPDVADEPFFVTSPPGPFSDHDPVGQGGMGLVASDIRLGPPRDLAYQEALGMALGRVEPILEDEGGGAEAVLARMESSLGLPVWIESRGPTAEEKRARGALPRR